MIWGHEHECLVDPEFVPTGGVADDGEDKGLFISQPGSSVATSLSDGEQKSKYGVSIVTCSMNSFCVDIVDCLA